jgi:molecular chaperone HscA
MAKIPINIKDGTLEKEDKLIVGIDLGTTNSLVAYMKKGSAQAVKDKGGKNTLVPSIIHFTLDGQILVGDKAKEQLGKFPERTIFSIKRLMGKSYDDLDSFKEMLSYKVIDEDTDSLVKIKLDDRFYTPIDLSAKILIALKARIEAELSQEVKQAVITVPAYFNDTQRQATRDAGKLAGLDVLRIINEPTAASLAYGIGLNPEEEKTIAVYDLGGGTFDISILQIQGGIFEVLSTHGDTFLGGDDIDHKIVNYWKSTIPADQDWQDKIFVQNIRLLAEKAKIHLSQNEQFEDQSLGYILQLSKTKLNELSQEIINKTMDSCKQALKDAKLDPSQVDEVILVGGSTRIPLVRESVSKFFQRPAHARLNPDEVVALGAAIQADILAGNQKNLLLLDVTPLSLGIETMGGLMDVIIPRNNKVPAKFARQYTTSIDGQRNLKVAVFQGERDLVQDNRKLGEFILKNIPPMPAGLPKIEIQFLIDADGILTVRAAELRSNVETQIEIRSQYGIDEEKMAKMLLDSIQHAEEDMQKRAVLEATNEAKNLLLATDKFIDQNPDILHPKEIIMIRQHMTLLEKSLPSEDKDQINAAIEKLNNYSLPFAKRAMDKTIQKALHGKKI